MKRVELALLFLILLGGLVVRLYKFDSPIADWHAWRQADTSSVSRNFAKDGFDLLHPRFDDLSNVPSGKDNPLGYRFVEFPIYNAFQAGFFVLTGGLTIEQWGRVVSIISSLISAVFLFLIVKRHVNTSVGLLTAFFFIFLPFSIYYGRSILPDPSTAMAILGGIYFFDTWIKKNQKLSVRSMWFILSLLFTTSAFLLKPFAIFFALPMAVLAYQRFKLNTVKQWQLWVFALISILPLIFWRLWMQQFPEGIPSNEWLFNAGNIRFKGAFFYWLFADRIGKLILGYWGVALFVLGIVRVIPAKEKMFLFSFLGSSLAYLFVIARGNVQHDYYQILIMPTIAIFVGLGAEFLLNPNREYIERLTARITLFVVASFTLAFGWYNIRDYFNVNNPSFIAAGKAVDQLVPKDAKVIAPNEGDTSFLYQTKRKGWASFEKPLSEMIKLGADYLVLANPTQKDYEGIGRDYKIVASSSEYIIFDLRQKL